MRSRFLLLLALFSASVAAAAEFPDAKIITQLRSRGEFEQAEKHGLKTWHRDDLSDSQRAELTIQLTLTYVEHALASPPPSRDELWRKAEQLCDAYLERWPRNPRRILVEVQRALALLARGEQLRDELQGAPVAAPATSEPAEYLRAAAREFDRITSAVEAQLLEAQRRTLASSSQDALSAVELESLSRHIVLYSARARRQLALCYPPRSNDRDDLLLQSLQRLEPLARQRLPDEVSWNARVEAIAVLRELGKLTQARKDLYDWQNDNPPPDASLRLKSQLIQLLLAEGHTNEALKVAGRAADSAASGKSTRAELALARLQAAVADWRRSQHTGRGPLAADLAAYVEAIGREYGPRWQRRAQFLVGGAAATAGTNEDARLVTLAAETLYHAGKIDEALTKYDQAEAFLRETASDAAFDVAMTAAAIERDAGRLASAAERYRDCAHRQPAHPRAAEAHRLVILCVADILRDSAPPDRQNLVAPYEELLYDHIARWPQDRSTDEVRLWLGKLLTSRREWSEARDALTAIGASSEKFATATRLALDSYERELAQFGDSRDQDALAKKAALLSSATQQIQPVITGTENRWPSRWTGLQRDVALGLAQLHLKYSVGPSDYAERLLAAALRGNPKDADDKQLAAWRDAAQCALVVALARNGKFADALANANNLQKAAPQSVISAVAALYDLDKENDTATDQQQRELGQIAVAFIRLLEARPEELDVGMKSEIDSYRGWALAAAGDRDAALANFAKAVNERPLDGDSQLQYAELLSAANSPAELREALTQWRQIEDHTDAGTTRWHHARQARIDVLRRLGETADAEKLLKLTRLLYPGWQASGTER